ncbi:hypothetical protein EV426DRAFT_705492 [Tirmania nivea]|nr:hypothetical protein EV426DRAFT_705492 [Tirmania nivea]
MLSQSLVGLNARSEETEPLEATDELQAIKKIVEGIEGSQNKGSTTKGDEPLKIDNDRDWQELQDKVI